MRKLIYTTLLAAFFTAAAFATDIDYVLTTSTDTLSFTLPQQPVAGTCQIGIHCFSVSPVSVTFDGNTFNNGVISFYLSDQDGGLTVLEGNTLLVNNDGPNNQELFTGSLTDPTLEVFSNLQLSTDAYDSPEYAESFALTATPVPEPLPMIAIPGAVLAAFGLLRRRRMAA